jgi:hypothetical protein
MESFSVDLPFLSSVVLVVPEGQSLSVDVSPSVRSKNVVAPVLDHLLLGEESSLPGSVLPWSSDGVATWSEDLGSEFS